KLSGPKLADLYADLTVQDKVERQLKKLKAEDLDKDGLKEAEVRQRMLELVHKYGLQDYISMPHFDGRSNDIPEDSHTDMIRDKKLKKLWKSAEYAGFSEKELEELKEEFWHQQMKIDEYNTLRDDIISMGELNDNAIEPGKDFMRSRKEKKMDLKVKEKQLKESYDKLETLAKASSYDNLEFKDPRVYELWALAKRAKMSEEELESFKSELKHFEHRLGKHDFYQEQLKVSEDAMIYSDKNLQIPDKHLQLEQKARDYERKVQKYHTDLRYRIDKALQHSEL
ncbi:hypothetical protein FSP39_020942, partial [Pinctada imbricata]